MDISVIVVTYNQEKTIGRTLDSILAQRTEASFEIVIGDDCSTDGTEEICRRYARMYPDKIRYYRRESNLGLVRNYYQCIEDSRGKYLADCAGDDFWVHPDKLQMQYEEMEMDAEVSLVHTGWLCCDSEGGNVRLAEMYRDKPRNKRMEFERGSIIGKLLRNESDTMIHLCTAMYRRDLLLSVYHADPELFVAPEYACEDLQIMVAMAAMGRIVYLPEVTLHYTVAEGSVSHQTDFGKKFRQVKGDLVLKERLRRHYGIDEAEMGAYYAKQLDYLAAQVFHSGRRDLLEEYLELKRGFPLNWTKGTKLRVKEFIMRQPVLWRILRRMIGEKSSR